MADSLATSEPGTSSVSVNVSYRTIKASTFGTGGFGLRWAQLPFFILAGLGYENQEQGGKQNQPVQYGMN